jgi:mannose-6-phosphate isomerase-like protein (cupin superfamily)
MADDVGNLESDFGAFTEHWRPKRIAELNGQEVKVVKVKGTFPWHRHEHCEEMFLVHRGVFRVEYRDRVVTLGAGEYTVVPRGVEHCTAADEEAEVLIFEPKDTVNTGDAPTSEYTAPNAVTPKGDRVPRNGG